MATTPRGRATHLSPDAHRLYQALIDHIIASGATPTATALARRTGLAARRVADALAELVKSEWAGRDDAGTLIALYPFAARPTGVRVRLGKVEREAMCAVDALGVAPMLGRTVVVTSSCPVCGAPLHLTVSPEGIVAALPEGLAVLRRRTPGPAHLTRCDATRFVCSTQHGEIWLAKQGSPDDLVESLPAAFAEARRLFGAAYQHGRCDCSCGESAPGEVKDTGVGCI